MATISRKRKILDLQQRMKVIERHEKGESARLIAASLHVGKTQIQSIIKEKDAVKNRWESGANSAQKYSKARRILYEDYTFTF